MAEVFISKKNENEIFIECEQHVLYELQEAFSFDVEGASFSPAYRKKFWDGKVRLLSIVKQTLPAGLTYRLCKFLDKPDYKWDFIESQYSGVPYEVDERICYEGVALFMTKIA